MIRTAFSLPRRSASLLALALLLCASRGGAAAPDVFKLGVLGPLSGPNAFAGKDNENGARLAVEELNKAGLKVAGRPLKLELQSEDDQGDPRVGVQAAQKLVDSGVRFVLGPYNSGVAIPASRVFNDAGVLMSTVGTHPKITQMGYSLVLRMVPSDAQVVAALARYAAKELKLKTVGVIDDRSAFGQGIASEFARQAKAAGIHVAGHEFTSDKASDFNAILTRLKAKKVEAVFFGGYAAQAAPMARQMRQLGLSARLLGGDTLCSPEMAKLGGDAVNDKVLCAQGGAPLERQREGAGFQQRYQARFGRKPDVYAPAFYDQVKFLAHAMRATNSTDPSVVATAMRASEYDGIAGSYAYDEAGNLKLSKVTLFGFRAGVPAAVATY
jgi:ABC-type branched-subunit amino acid transport system substrate-binding protein